MTGPELAAAIRALPGDPNDPTTNRGWVQEWLDHFGIYLYDLEAGIFTYGVEQVAEKIAECTETVDTIHDTFPGTVPRLERDDWVDPFTTPTEADAAAVDATRKKAADADIPKTVPVIKTWAAGNADRIVNAIVAEAARKNPRKSLVAWLDEALDNIDEVSAADTANTATPLVVAAADPLTTIQPRHALLVVGPDVHAIPLDQLPERYRP